MHGQERERREAGVRVPVRVRVRVRARRHLHQPRARHRLEPVQVRQHVRLQQRAAQAHEPTKQSQYYYTEKYRLKKHITVCYKHVLFYSNENSQSIYPRLVTSSVKLPSYVQPFRRLSINIRKNHLHEGIFSFNFTYIQNNFTSIDKSMSNESTR